MTKAATQSTSLNVIHSNFPIERLLDRDQLEPYARPHELTPHQVFLKNSGLTAARLTFLKPDFQPITLPTPSLDLCTQASLAIHGYNACATCPMRLNPPQDQSAISVKCGLGHLARSVAAIRVNSQIVGYVCGPTVPSDDFYRLDLRRLPQPLRDDLLEHRKDLQALDPGASHESVSRIARRLSRRCELERRLKILRHTRKRIVRSVTEAEVLEAGFCGLQSFFGDVDVAFYMLTERGILKLIDAVGPNHLSQPETMESKKGHVGRVIATQDAFYALDLAQDLEGFISVDSGPPKGSVYTVPIVWGAGERKAALQIASSTPRQFAKADQQSIRVIADMMALAGVRLALKQERRSHRIGGIRMGPWGDCMMNAIAAPASTLVQILEAKQRLMQGLAEEARLCADSSTAAVQLYDASAQSLRFAACSGQGWTDETKAIEHKLGEPSTGMHAFEAEEELLVPNMEEEKRFRRVLVATRAVYAYPFRSGDMVIGVLSVCWNHTLLPGSPPPHKEKLVQLVYQCESVFDVLNSREREIKLRLVSTLASLPTLNNEELAAFAKETVSRTKIAFGVRGCSIFLVFPGQDSARLVATTGVMPDDPIWYALGEGLTGWVLKNKRCLRLRDTLNLDELHSIDPNLKGVRKWTGDEEYRDAEGKRRFLAAPLICAERVVGVIRLTIKENLHDFTSEEETLLLQIAHEMAETVDAGWKQAEARESSAAKAAQIQQLHLIGLGFAEISDVDTLIKQVLAIAITESKMKWGIIRRLNDAQNSLRLRAFQGPPVQALPPTLELNPLVTQSLAAPELMYIPDTAKSELWKEMLETISEPARKNYLRQIQTAIHVPIRLRDRTMGLILLESPTLIEVPERVRQFLCLLGGYAAVALELAETRQRLRDELDSAKPFQEVGILMIPCLHDIRNRANDLKATVTLMRKMVDDRTGLDDEIASMGKQVGSLQEICQQLKNVTQRKRAEMETVNLEDLVSRAIQDYSPVPDGIKIELHVHGSFNIRAHPASLRSAFYNIIRNAMEAMPQGGLLSVAVEPVDGKPAVGFADNGLGMDPITKSRILQLFYTTKTASEGRGLGLAAVHGIMMLHDGRVRIESQLGKGSKFTLVFMAEETRK